MSINDLIEQLEGLREDFGGDTEVRLAMQPNWPFEYAIADVQVVEMSPEFEEGDDDEEVPDVENETTVVYLLEGEQLGYLPGYCSKQFGWR